MPFLIRVIVAAFVGSLVGTFGIGLWTFIEDLQGLHGAPGDWQPFAFIFLFPVVAFVTFPTCLLVVTPPLCILPSTSPLRRTSFAARTSTLIGPAAMCIWIVWFFKGQLIINGSLSQGLMPLLVIAAAVGATFGYIVAKVKTAKIG